MSLKTKSPAEYRLNSSSFSASQDPSDEETHVMQLNDDLT